MLCILSSRYLRLIHLYSHEEHEGIQSQIKFPLRGLLPDLLEMSSFVLASKVLSHPSQTQGAQSGAPFVLTAQHITDIMLP
jgi:hypothetical protein